MDELPMSIRRSIRNYEEIRTDGLTLFPVLVYEYELFSIARPALEVMHQSLPVALLRVPLLTALYRMDLEAAVSGKAPTGLFTRTLLALALSLRLGDGKEPEERVGLFQVVANREQPGNLICLRYTDADGEAREITPARYQTLRKIIAAQNGVRLESDLANPDLVKAQRDMASVGSVALDANTDDLISAVAALCGVEEREIDRWPILKLERRSESCRRILDYLVCGFGEVNGTTWKGGNPTPHPFFRRSGNGNGVLTLMGGAENGKTTAPRQAAELYDASKNL